jgi:hypothetical protein
VHTRGETGRLDESLGGRSPLDLPGLALQLGERRPIIPGRDQPLGDAEEKRELLRRRVGRG